MKKPEIVSIRKSTEKPKETNPAEEELRERSEAGEQPQDSSEGDRPSSDSSKPESKPKPKPKIVAPLPELEAVNNCEGETFEVGDNIVVRNWNGQPIVVTISKLYSDPEGQQSYAAYAHEEIKGGFTKAENLVRASQE